MLFSATLNSYVKNLAWEYTRDPAEITIAAENITVDEIDQELLHVSSSDKTRLLLGIINSEKPESLIIFCNTKRSCEVIAKRLRINGIETEFIIGDLPQKKRLAIMDKFKAGQVKCLVATDVAARGIDVNDLAMVINYDLPNEAENYVHRIGRTARAGKSGKAYTFCSEQDVYSLPPIERYIEKQIPARVAEESMMAEDKSKDMYIKTDSYHEEYNDKSEFGRMRQAQYERSGRGKKHGSRDGSKGSGRYSSRNEDAKKEYRRDRRVYNPADEEALASMSSEERMKLYKEKYAGKANAKATRNGGHDSRKVQTNGSYKKNDNRKKKGNNKPNNNRSSGKQIQQPKKTNEKKSFFGRLKSLFSKK